MPTTLADFATLLTAEYEWLLKRLKLPPVTLEPIDAPPNAAPKDYFPRYGGSPRRITFPMTVNDLAVIHQDSATVAPPQVWDDECRDGYWYWSAWRVFFWHEVCHQVQDAAGSWDPNDDKNGHSEPAWSRAIDYVSAATGCAEPQLLYALLASDDTGNYVAP